MPLPPYQILDETKNEIRLVTIEPFQRAALVRCHLSTVSLKDFRPEYSSFVHAINFVGHSARRVLPQWIEFRKGEGRVASRQASSAFPVNCQPSPGACRYRWGDFAALSYVWGEEQSQRKIFLNGELVSVRQNLEAALRTLAENNEFQDNFKIWIDAICINQNDTVERENQVRKMREIYSGAWAVVSWLGRNDGQADVKDAFHLLRTLAFLGEDGQDLAQLLNRRRGLLREGSFFSLHELMQRPYWSRLWVIQEIVMGASFTILRCDDELLDWDTFCRGIAVLYRGDNWTLKDRLLASERVQRNLERDPRWFFISNLHLVHQALRELSLYEGEGSQNRLGFHRLLQVASSGNCKYAQDKVFSLLGLMDPQIAREVAHDYSLDPPRLFAAVAKAFITHTKSLEPLRQANPWGMQFVPTWTADWTWKGHMPSWRPGSIFTGPIGNIDVSNVRPKPETLYNAHNGTPAAYKFFDDWQYVQCDGFILDVVGGLGAPERGLFQWDAAKILSYPSWRSAYGDRDQTARALFGALLGLHGADDDEVQLHNSALSSLPSTFLAASLLFTKRGWTWLANQGGYYYKWENWRLAHNNFLLGEQTLGSYFTDIIPDNADESAYIDVYCNAREMVMERRFMLTRHGYLGWAPDNADDENEKNHVKVGDLVAIVFGCSTPLIIRPREERFQVIGEAYIQGFMNGEAFEGGECEAQSFLFC